MIQPVFELPDEIQIPSGICLVRYGAVPEVARFTVAEGMLQRGQPVVVQTQRGLQLGTVLEWLKPSGEVDPADVEFHVVRVATAEDLARSRQLAHDCEESFPQWCARISQWNLNLELVDLERTLDGEKQILYVLCERGPDSTKLALQAAASGLGIIEVQPVSTSGPVQMQTGGSCGTGGCGCSH